MKPMKKSIIVFGAILVAILLVSTATAVEQANSEPIRNYVEGEEQADFMIQLEETGASVYVEPMYQDYTMADFINFLLSDEFIDFMKSPEITDFLSSDLFLEIYNSDGAQEFIQSGEFRNFRFSTVASTFLEKYRAKAGQTLIGSTNVNNQCTSSESQLVNSAVGMNSYMQATTPVNTNEETSSSMTTNVVCDETEESMSSTLQNTEHIAAPGSIEDIVLLFAYLLIGLITWPIAYYVFGTCAPELGVLLGFYAALKCNPENPIELIMATAVFGFALAVCSILIAIGWPLIWGIFLDWWFP